mmetsp:Transcript_11341/g.22831  ORF Transcript_11341/g.22831 Transcript_11341/m.22831 type:complete len:346 (-) Transcript_11341:64-1101(-)
MKMRLTASCRQLLRRASLPLLLYVLVSFVRKIYQSRKGWKLIHGLEDKRMAKIKKTLPKRFGMYPSSLWTPLLPIFLNGWLNMFYVMLLKKVIQDRFRREEIERPDGGVVSVDWLSGWGQESLPENAPLLLVLTTITGKSSDHSIWLRAAAQRGYRVCVFHRRGHDLPLKTPRFNIMGCADDAHAQVSYVRSKYNKSEFVAMAGLSAGSGLLITYLGRYAEETPVQAACCLCPAYEMNIWKMLDDKYPRVASHMLESVRNQWVRDNSDMLHSHDSKAAKAVERATSLSDFVEAHAPFTGDGDYSGWLVRSNPMKHFQKVHKRTKTSQQQITVHEPSAITFMNHHP